MYEKKRIIEYLADMHTRELPNIVKRDLKISAKNKIISIYGPRRAGKTYFLYQIMSDLKFPKSDMIHLNFEDSRLIEVNYKEFYDIIKEYWIQYPQSSKEELIIFIDEPQNIEKWEIGVRDLYDKGFQIYITGSSSKMLSKEISTHLRGRALSYMLLPFSLPEFLRLKKVSLNSSSSKEKSVLLGLVNEFVKYGSYPEVLLEPIEENKQKILNSYLDLVIYRDIIERHSLQNTRLIKWLIEHISQSFSKEYSVNKVFNTLKSQGIKISKTSLYNYISILEDSLFIFLLKPYSKSVRKRDQSINKIYLCDVGFCFNDFFGQKLENTVFLHLMRNLSIMQKLSYYKSRQSNYEVDFVVEKNGKVWDLIQVCYDIDNVETKKREIRALLHASKELGCNNLTIVTLDYEGTEEFEWFGSKGEVNFVPVWKFCKLMPL